MVAGACFALHDTISVASITQHQHDQTFAPRFPWRLSLVVPQKLVSSQTLGRRIRSYRPSPRPGQCLRDKLSASCRYRRTADAVADVAEEL